MRICSRLKEKRFAAKGGNVPASMTD